MKSIPKEFVTTPIVYAVKNTYQIMVPVNCETVMWVKVGDQCFYDDSNGILRSALPIHRVTVPMGLLDQEKKYTVYYRIIHERKPYFTESSDVMCYESRFRPVEQEPVHIYHIADAHNCVDAPIAAGRYFGEALDLLVLNGDIPNHSGDIACFTTIYNIAAQLTNGEIPVVFSRGNHDTRGIYAEKFEDYTPTDHGKSYYTFRVGHVWGIVLDCGEDKPDDHAAYGHTICCEDFRRRQIDYLKEVIATCKKEYEELGVKNRLVICHIPFSEQLGIEKDTYSEWASLLSKKIRPQLMICGHIHKAYVSDVGGEKDYIGQPCPVVVGSQTSKEENSFVGCAVTLYAECCNVKMTDNRRVCILEKNLHFQDDDDGSEKENENEYV